MANFIVTIDGPAASGKTTVARLLAQRLDAGFLDTGAMYRVVTLAAMRAGVDMADQAELLRIIEGGRLQFTLEPGRTGVSLDGADVTDQIRTPEVTKNARYAASAPKVRAKLVEMQRKLAADARRIVTEGRDQGTIAFPDADFKFFLTADPRERAKRRQAEIGAAGRKQAIGQTLSDIEARDKSDENRQVGPLKPAEDAIIVDTTSLTIEQVVQKLIDYIEDQP